jgi:glycerophosphoryl diester phosphodiesterase
VGWHNLYVNRIAIQLAKQLRLFTYIYTINQRQIAQKLIKQGIDGIITDYPDRLILLESKQKTHR